MIGRGHPYENFVLAVEFGPGGSSISKPVRLSMDLPGAHRDGGVSGRMLCLLERHDGYGSADLDRLVSVGRRCLCMDIHSMQPFVRSVRRFDGICCLLDRLQFRTPQAIQRET